MDSKNEGQPENKAASATDAKAAAEPKGQPRSGKAENATAAVSEVPTPAHKTYRVKHGQLFAAPDRIHHVGQAVVMAPEQAELLVRAGLLEEV
ncbi:hypothetical protein LZC95_19840 [Pendulispora brunnea]|uniref:Uncharacterized protein n=1 Tax=Pendulispora brunnea TaxID=2905690 RepID=A0ABZ2KK57_9BACT